MKTIALISVLFVGIFTNAKAQTTHTINASGLSFTPSSITISVGDIVQFNVGSTHPVLEVSKSTWDANGSTALSGGFAFPSGNGSVTMNTTGTFYYICENHISSGMKGAITVGTTTNTRIVKDDKSVSMYPVPLNDDFLNVRLNQEKLSKLNAIKIYDLTGRVRIILSSINQKNIQIDCSLLNPGAYIIHLENDDSISTTKFIRQ